MNADSVKRNCIQGQGVQVSKNAHRKVAVRSHRQYFSGTPFVSVISLIVLSSQLYNATATEGASHNESNENASSTALVPLGRRDAIKKNKSLRSPHVTNTQSGACPVCVCPGTSYPVSTPHENASAHMGSEPVQSVFDASTQTPVHTSLATSDASVQTDNQITNQSDQLNFTSAGGELSSTTSPDSLLYATQSDQEASFPAFTRWSEQEHRQKVNFLHDDYDSDSEKEEEKASPEWFFVTGRRGAGKYRNIEKFFKQWLRKRFGKKYDSSVCNKLKRDGRQPSAALRHSPIEVFGYPVFDERSGRTFLERRLPLSIVQGHLVPVRVGAEDYVIQGTFDQVSSFLECFEDYQVIASKLQPDGHWSADEELGPLFLQVQNTLQDLESPFDNSKFLFRWGFDKLLRTILTARSLKFLTDSTPYEEVMNIIDNVENVGDFLPHVTKEELFEFWEELSNLPTFPDRVQLLYTFLRDSFSRSKARRKSGWTEDGKVDLRRPMTLTLTSYPKPSHGLRLTYAMASNVVVLRDVKEALSQLFHSSTMAYGLREANLADREGNLLEK